MRKNWVLLKQSRFMALNCLVGFLAIFQLAWCILGLFWFVTDS